MWTCHPMVQRTYRSQKYWVVLPPTCPNMKHCLEIHATLTDELGPVSLPSHSWMVPLVEDMLHDARTGLTKAVVTGPCRPVLSHGRHSMGEGLTKD